MCGDVGSGKTVVAISACLLAVENNYQACFIAPTEILAEQHYITFKKFLYGLNLKFEVLTSGTPKKKKQEILEGLINGEIDIIVGTHSLMEENVRFKNLALVIIDEQHRFGVRQRATVRKKGDRVDILVMTATPIPRTLFLALYGDLDLSVLTDMPPGKGKIMTFHTDEKTAFDEAKKQIEKGFQVYIVFPVIEESSKKEIKSLLKEYERIKDIFAPNKVSFIHGSMSSKEKQSIMQEFANGDIKVLCATPVIEVGIDVPNATVMIIENAERFGIASLHQLRGRVGRGRNDGYCFLISDVRSGDAYERIKALCETTNGFELSEKDAYIRGVGEILGTKQHGDIEFRIASIYRDKEILSMVLEDKEKILLDDPYLRDFSNYRLKKEVFEIYGEKWNIVDMS
jgi:ATP-dependent DNA helicase RecG